MVYIKQQAIIQIWGQILFLSDSSLFTSLAVTQITVRLISAVN